MNKKKPYYLVTSLQESSIDPITGDIATKTNQLSTWYSNEEIFSNTRARRRIARKFYANNPLFAFSVLKQAMPQYDYETFWSDITPGKKHRGKIPYSAKKDWIRQQLTKLDSLNQRQINTLIDQMYNGPHWKVTVNLQLEQAQYVIVINKRVSVSQLQSFVEWINAQNRTIKEIDEYRMKNGLTTR